MTTFDFQLHPALIDSAASSTCRASVIVPARNEELSLAVTLDALRLQTGLKLRPLARDDYEVILLLNNCTDATAEIAYEYQRRHPTLRLHIAERSLPIDRAHVGTARQLLMDTAFQRIRHSSHPHTAILSTDADTTVAPDWIFRNLCAIEAGAEVVGGAIHLNPSELSHLDRATQIAYRQDRRYRQCVARLESLLDPDPADPWPRHLDHYGASLACTPAVYARSGGLPPVKPLEDVAFIDACRRVDARIRHSPDVFVTTSARLRGRAEGGLSSQLRSWQQDCTRARPQHVETASYLAHRFSTLARLRSFCTRSTLPPLRDLPQCWREPLFDIHPLRLGLSNFLSAIDCDRLIDETFQGLREDSIHVVIPELGRFIARAAKLASIPPAGISLAATSEQYATLAD